MDLAYELSVATRLAEKAGHMALSLRPQLIVSYKPQGQGPVTNIDQALNDYLCQELVAAFPHDRIISEEADEDHDLDVQKGRTWFIDPIDGTTALVAGTDDFVVMIGLAIDGIARLGVIFQPTTNLLWRGIYGSNSYAERLHHTSLSKLAVHQQTFNTLRIIASISHNSLRQKAMIRALSPSQVIQRSSIGLKAMLILDDEADFYVAWSKSIKLWDTCAPCAIINAAGGYIASIDEQPLSFLGALTHGKPIIIARQAPTPETMSILQAIAKA